MTYQYKLQVPISKKLNSQIKKRAEEIGLNSVTDVARLLLTSFAQGKLSISFTEREEASNVEIASQSLEEIIANAFREYTDGNTKSLDLSKPLDEQLCDD